MVQREIYDANKKCIVSVYSRWLWLLNESFFSQAKQSAAFAAFPAGIISVEITKALRTHAMTKRLSSRRLNSHLTSDCAPGGLKTLIPAIPPRHTYTKFFHLLLGSSHVKPEECSTAFLFSIREINEKLLSWTQKQCSVSRRRLENAWKPISHKEFMRNSFPSASNHPRRRLRWYVATKQ